MLNKNIKSVGVFLSLSILIGCGGGGGGSDGSVASSSESVSQTETISVTEVVTEEPNNEIQSNTQAELKMSELQAETNFTFSSKNQIEVSIDVNSLLVESDQVGERAYLSIYRDYTILPSGQFYPDSSSRVLAGELSGGVFNQSFVALNNQSSYLVEVWFYNGEKPIQEELSLIANELIL